MMDYLRQQHAGSNREYAGVMDDQGYVRLYKKGNSGSVSFKEGELRNGNLWHNHPQDGWGNFSGADLELLAKNGIKRIVAESLNRKPRKGTNKLYQYVYSRRKAGRYTITKGSHFKAKQFFTDIHNLKVDSNNYDVELSKWLKANQKKYGYIFTYDAATNKRY